VVSKSACLGLLRGVSEYVDKRSLGSEGNYPPRPKLISRIILRVLRRINTKIRVLRILESERVRQRILVFSLIDRYQREVARIDRTARMMHPCCLCEKRGHMRMPLSDVAQVLSR
jgi:hypothetical protein